MSERKTPLNGAFFVGGMKVDRTQSGQSSPEKSDRQLAKAMGWNNRVDVARHKALKVLKDAGAWDELIVPTFEYVGTDTDDDEGTEIVPTGTKSIFTEHLLREILDLDAGHLLRNRPLRRWAGGCNSASRNTRHLRK